MDAAGTPCVRSALFGDRQADGRQDALLSIGQASGIVVDVQDLGDQVPVSDLSHYGRVWLISTDDGTAVVGDGRVTCHGVCLPYPEPMSALFVHDGTIWLQVGHHKWDTETIQEVRQVAETISKATYELVLVDGRRETVEVRFPGSVRRMRVIDPTRDEIASWSEDIMKTLPYIASDGWTSSSEDVSSWRARVLPLWKSGISPR